MIQGLVEKLEQEEANSEAPSDELLREAVINCRQNETFLRIILVSWSSLNF